MDTLYYTFSYFGIAVAHVLFFVLGGRRGWFGDTEETDNQNEAERGTTLLFASAFWIILWPAVAVIAFCDWIWSNKTAKQMGIQGLKYVAMWLVRVSKPYTPNSTLRKLQQDYNTGGSK